MPEKEQEIAHFQLQKYFEEGILAGIGVLLAFLGMWSNEPMTNALSFGIGIFLFYAAFEVYRSKKSLNGGDFTDRDFNQPPEEVEEELYTEFISEPRVPEHRQAEPALRQKSEKGFHASDFVEAPSKLLMSNLEPQSEFNNLLQKALSAIKEVCFAHTVAFFWVNQDSNQLVVEAKISDSSSFIGERKMNIGNDVVSRISVSGQPEVINDIASESEREIVRYYTSLQDVKSFIGVPVFYANDPAAQKPVAVIGIDSKAQDAFGDETFSILAQFSKLISAMLVSYTEKYDLMNVAKLLDAESRLQRKLSSHPTVALIVNSFLEEIERIVSWDAMAVVLFDETQQQWAIASVRTRANGKFTAAKQLIDFENSIAGNAIRTSMVQNVVLTQNTIPVFHSSESGMDVLKHGALIAVPLVSNGKCFGTSLVINSKIGSFDKKEYEALSALSSTVSTALEIVELNAIMNEHIVIDELTGALTKKYFLSRLTDELHRATDRTEDLSLVLVSVSNVPEIEQRYGVDGKKAALMNISQQLRASVREYDIVARFDDTTFALVLADTVANDAFLWAEKLRTSISSSIIHVNSKSFSVSVTIGVSGAAARMTKEELLKNATYVLDQAKRAGGNIVRVF